MSFIKLKEISAFRVTKVEKSLWKGWDEANKKFITFDSYPKEKPKGIEIRKAWVLECSEGTLELSSAQFSQMLESCFVTFNGSSEPVGKRFTVKNNGQQGKDIRYWINLCYDQSETEDDVRKVEPEAPSTTENVDSIPF